MVDLLSSAFHPNARLVGVKNEGVFITLTDYLQVVEKQGATMCETSIVSTQIDGNRAIVATSFDYGEKKYDDYLVLVKENNQWLIVNKTFEKK